VLADGDGFAALGNRVENIIIATPSSTLPFYIRFARAEVNSVAMSAGSNGARVRRQPHLVVACASCCRT